MTARSRVDVDERRLLLQLLPICGAQAGPSVAAVTLFWLTDKGVRLLTLADALLAIRQYNKQPKPVKWRYFDPSRRTTSDSAVTAH